MTLYVAVTQCDKCKKPALGYDWLKQHLGEEKGKPQLFPVRCLISNCGWQGVVNRNEAIAVFDVPWVK